MVAVTGCAPGTVMDGEHDARDASSRVPAEDASAHEGGSLSLDAGALDGSFPADAGLPRTDGASPSVDAGDTPSNDGGAPPEPSPHAPPTEAALAYFAGLDTTLRDEELVRALHDKLAADHVALTYDGLLQAYASVDRGRGGCTDIFDFYSEHCWAPEDACGNYQVEGDCFNREHTWPKSWWGGAMSPAQHQDLISVLPSDGFVNSVRANLPLGETNDADFVSSNGSERGPCSVSGARASALCFEPAPALKGDFARIYFYQATRYQDEFSCCDEEAVLNADIRAWQETMLRAWHEADPVDLAERERNERVFVLQKNRNPFVDLPFLVNQIEDF